MLSKEQARLLKIAVSEANDVAALRRVLIRLITMLTEKAP